MELRLNEPSSVHVSHPVHIIFLAFSYLYRWSYDPGFYGNESFMRIMVRGEAIEPPTIIRVLATGDPLPVDLAFEYDRQRD